MIHIVKIKSKESLKKVLKHLDGKIESAQFLIASEIIRRKDLPKEALVLNYSFLIPPPVLITMYSYEGRSKDYEEEYLRSLSHTANFYFLNEALLTSAQLGLDLFLVCALDEEEYGYIDLACEFIEEHYNVHPIGAKKFIGVKSMSGGISERDLYGRSKVYKERLGRKLKDSYLDAESLFENLIYEKDKKRLRKKS